MATDEMIDVMKGLKSEISGLKDSFSDVVTAMLKMTKGSGAASSALEDLEDTLSGNAEQSKKLKDAITEMKLSLVEINKAADKNTASFKQSQASYKAALGNAIAAKNAMMEESILRQQIDDDIKRNAKSYQTLGGAISKAQGHIVKWGGVLGMTSISIEGAKKQLIDYNASMFKFDRVQQLMGKGSANMTNAFKIVENQTTLSRKQFAGFMETAASGWKGVVPTSEAFANLAKNLQSSFGPSVAATEAGLKSLLGLMDKFPAMSKAIINANDKMNKGADNEKERKSLIATIRLRESNEKISSEEADKLVQMLTKTTAEQNKRVAAEKALGKVAQKTDDAVLSASQQLESTLTITSNLLEKGIGYLEKFPQLINASAAAFALMNKSMIIPNIGNIFKGGKAFRSKKGSSELSDLRSGSGAHSKDVKSYSRDGGILRAARRRARRGRIGGGAIGLATGAYSGYQSGKEEYESRLKGSDEYEAQTQAQAKKAGTGKGLRTGAGAVIGGVIGGALGSFAGPVGIMLGASLGASAGEGLGKKWGDSWAKKAVPLIKKAADESKDELDTISQSSKKYNELLANYRNAVDQNKTNVGLLQQQLDAMKEMGQFGGGNAAKFFAPLLATLKDTVDQSSKFITKMFEKDGMGTTAGAVLGENIMVGLKSSIAGKGPKEAMDSLVIEAQAQMENLKKESEVLSNKKDNAKGSEEKENISSEIDSNIAKQDKLRQLIGITQKASSEFMEAELAYVKGRNQSTQQEADQMTQMMSISERRLDMERSLAEAAQFGLGVSVTMMQRQIGFAEQQIKLQKESMDLKDKEMVEALKKSGKLNDAEANAAKDKIKNAESVIDAQKIVNGLNLGEYTEKKQLLPLYTMQQDASLKIMEQEKKIYDLTKDIREGYLGAIREMSVGAVEFSKIIGTQEMGATQLMEVVDRATESGKDHISNTFGMGGRQSKQTTAKGTRTGITGKYSATGKMLSFIGKDGPDGQEERNKGIHGYSESVAKAKSMGEGNQHSTAGTSAGPQEGIRAIQAENNVDVTANSGVTIKTDNIDVKGGFTINGKTSTDIMEGIPTDRKGFQPIETKSLTAGSNFGAAIATKAEGTPPANIPKSAHYKKGGNVGATGVAFLHEGEQVLTPEEIEKQKAEYELLKIYKDKNARIEKRAKELKEKKQNSKEYETKYTKEELIDMQLHGFNPEGRHYANMSLRERVKGYDRNDEAIRQIEVEDSIAQEKKSPYYNADANPNIRLKVGRSFETDRASNEAQAQSPYAWFTESSKGEDRRWGGGYGPEYLGKKDWRKPKTKMKSNADYMKMPTLKSVAGLDPSKTVGLSPTEGLKHYAFGGLGKGGSRSLGGNFGGQLRKGGSNRKLGENVGDWEGEAQAIITKNGDVKYPASDDKVVASKQQKASNITIDQDANGGIFAREASTGGSSGSKINGRIRVELGKGLASGGSSGEWGDTIADIVESASNRGR